MRGQVESIQDPEWWDADTVMDVVDHVCEKAGRNSGVAAIFKGNKKQPIMAKVSMRHLNEMIREKNAFAREVDEAWQDYVHLKTRMDSEVAKVTKRNNILNDQLEHWKQEVQILYIMANGSLKNSKGLHNNLVSRRKNSNPRSRRRNARLAVLHLSSTNKKPTSNIFKENLTDRNATAKKFAKPSPISKPSPKISKQREPNSKSIWHLCEMQMNIPHRKEMKLSRSYCIYAS
jgi:hypothetical protein